MIQDLSSAWNHHDALCVLLSSLQPESQCVRAAAPPPHLLVVLLRRASLEILAKLAATPYGRADAAHAPDELFPPRLGSTSEASEPSLLHGALGIPEGAFD